MCLCSCRQRKPKSLDDFIILGKLGSGYFGSVSKVQYKGDEKVYALKSISQEKFKMKENEALEIDYIREKHILYDLTKKNNPHIVKLYADFQDSKSRYLLMEFCEGTTLQNLRGNVSGGYVDQNLVNLIFTINL